MKKLVVIVGLILNLFSFGQEKQSIKKRDSYSANSIEKKYPVDYFDSIRNFYANYKYKVAVSAPKNWKREGVPKGLVFRTVEKDSGYTFSVGVEESKVELDNRFWVEYDKNKPFFHAKLKNKMEESLNTKMEIDFIRVSYIKNFKSIKQKYNFTLLNNDTKYEMTFILHQVPKGKYIYAFGLTVPRVFYDANPQRFEDIFDKVFILPDSSAVDYILTNPKTK